MKQKYRFRISSQDNNVVSASKRYGHDASIVDDEHDFGPYCFFTSPHLSNLSDPKEIWARGLFLSSIYNGATNLYYFHPLVESSFQFRIELIELFDWETDENITPVKTYDIEPSISFDTSLLTWHSDLINLNPVAKSMYFAKSNDDVLTLLLQFGNGLEWINLFAILDSIKTFSSQFRDKFYTEVLEHTGYTESDVSAFTGTVNNFKLIGVSARHGLKEKGQGIPNKTYTLAESQNLILSLGNSYLWLRHGIK